MEGPQPHCEPTYREPTDMWVLLQGRQQLSPKDNPPKKKGQDAIVVLVNPFYLKK